MELFTFVYKAFFVST